MRGLALPPLERRGQHCGEPCLNRRKLCGDSLVAAANSPPNLRMERGDKLYIWEEANWPDWHYDLSALAPALAETSAQSTLASRQHQEQRDHVGLRARR